ncbi:MAG: hypothetical protein DMG70_25680 [Acidobacteria bacterium]|nr:MAG: hypothetical protein DMG70_25680 [Acidobacteriota bacterium]
MAAGVAALVKSANPGLNPAQIRTILEQPAQDLGKKGYDLLFNFSLVDDSRACSSPVNLQIEKTKRRLVYRVPRLLPSGLLISLPGWKAAPPRIPG